MAWNGSGTFNLNPTYSPEVNGTTIDAVRYNGLLTDVAAGITATLAKNGENVPTANLPMGGFKLTGLAAPTASGDSLAFGSPMGAISGTTGTFSGAVSGTTATFTGDVQMASQNGGQLAGLRNRIINGDMRLAQRGATGALTIGYTYISVDRFAGAQAAAANGVLAQVAAGLDGFQYAAKIGRTAASTNTGVIILRSALETTNSVSLQGQQVTLSFYAKAGANFSATSSNITAQIFTGTGTDQSVSIMNTWTGVASPVSSNQAITTGWVRYSFTATLSSTATQVGLTLFYTPVGTAGADDNLYITGVQLEVGPVATPFEQRPIGMELALCQRYTYTISSTGVTQAQSSFGTGASTSTVRLTYQMPVTMRTNPSFTFTGAASGFQVSDASVPTTCTNFTSIGTGLQFSAVNAVVAGTPLTVFRPYVVERVADGTILIFSAEL